MLQKWTKRINLVSKNTEADAWRRHILDSVQIMLYAPDHVENWLDLGSGGGLPALVVAIVGGDSGRVKRVTMVESDVRKSVFLNEVKRELGLDALVLNARIEAISPQPSKVISARALTDLNGLLSYSWPHTVKDSRLLFPKGMNFRAELEDARKSWVFDAVTHKSLTDPDAAIVAIENLHPKTRDPQ